MNTAYASCSWLKNVFIDIYTYGTFFKDTKIVSVHTISEMNGKSLLPK